MECTCYLNHIFVDTDLGVFRASTVTFLVVQSIDR